MRGLQACHTLAEVLPIVLRSPFPFSFHNSIMAYLVFAVFTTCVRLIHHPHTPRLTINIWSASKAWQIHIVMNTNSSYMGFNWQSPCIMIQHGKESNMNGASLTLVLPTQVIFVNLTLARQRSWQDCGRRRHKSI